MRNPLWHEKIEVDFPSLNRVRLLARSCNGLVSSSIYLYIAFNGSARY